MFLFEGCLSEKCQNYIIQKNQRMGFVGGSVVAAVFAIPTILISIFWEWIVMLFLIGLIGFPFLVAVKPSPKTARQVLFPQKIEFDITEENAYVSAEGENFCLIKKTEDIKAIIDMGDFFVVLFYFPHKDIRFVCEKALLREGTLEEFEAHFSELMIRNP